MSAAALERVTSADGTSIAISRSRAGPDWRREAMDRLQATPPQAELGILAGQGHLVTHTAPELLAGEILSFLERR